MAEVSWAAGRQAGAADSRANAIVLKLGVLFFFSGFPALLYQLVWQRALFRIFGVNIEAVTIVVTAFMVGLGLGSLFGGYLSKRGSRAVLLLLAAIEAVTGLFGLVSLAIFERVGEAMIGQPLPVVATAALGLVLMPTLLMGATLPLLSAWLAKRSRNTGYSVGYLYFVNTLGAAAACLAGMALFFPFMGMQGSIYVAVAINAAVALGAVRMHLRQDAGENAGADAEENETHAANVRPALRMPEWLVLSFGAMAGMVALAYEIFLFRIMSFVSGNMASAFALVLAIFLLGIAFGSQSIATMVRRTPERAGRHVLFNLVFAAAAGALLLPALALAAKIQAGLVQGCLLLAVYLIARAWGMLLPFLAHAGIDACKGTGSAVSRLYFANIVGSATGSILTGFILLDHLSLTGVSQLLAGVSVAGIALLYGTLGGQAVRLRPAQALVAGAAILAGIALHGAMKPAQLMAALMYGPEAGNRPAIVKVAENRGGIITVDADGVVMGHGMYDGRFNTDLFPDTNIARRPYSLSLFHPAPRDVLMIGLATGSWGQIIVNNPHVRSLTIVEINPGYTKLVSEEPHVRSLLANPKVKLVVDDGRRWLRANPDAKFDFVVSNTTWFYRANITNLLSQEFLKIVEGHLNPGGMFFYNTTWSHRVQRTACLAFPNGLRFNNHMLVSRQKPDVDFRRWREVLLGYTIDGHKTVDLSKPVHAKGLDMLMGYEKQWKAENGGPEMQSCTSILRRTEGLEPVTDDNMGSEWRKLYFPE
ncbi:MAG: MFS transporter [Beijerinckiaceae bacterium]